MKISRIFNESIYIFLLVITHYCLDMLRKTLFGAGVAGFSLSHQSMSSLCAGSAVTSSSRVERPKSGVKPCSLKSKTVLITGATAGIGLACTWRFAGLCYRVS